MHAATEGVTQHPPFAEASRAWAGDVFETAPCGVGVDRDISKQNQDGQADEIGKGKTIGCCPARGGENTVEHRHASPCVRNRACVREEEEGRRDLTARRGCGSRQDRLSSGKEGSTERGEQKKCISVEAASADDF